MKTEHVDTTYFFTKAFRSDTTLNGFMESTNLHLDPEQLFRLSMYADVPDLDILEK